MDALTSRPWVLSTEGFLSSRIEALFAISFHGYSQEEILFQSPYSDILLMDVLKTQSEFSAV
jgi:hypothetical protein